MAKNKFENREVLGEDKKKVTKDRAKKAWKLTRFVKPYASLFFAGLFFLLLSNATILSFPFLTGKLIDAATGKGVGILASINTIAILLIGILLLQSAFSFFRVLLFSKVSEFAMANIRQNLYNKLIYMPMAFFEKRRVGELTSRITSDVSQLQDVLSITFAEFLRQIFTLLIGTTIILVTSTQLSVFMLLTFPILVVAAMFFGKTIRTLSRKTQDELAAANVVVEETLQSVQVVKVFTNEKLESNRYKNAINRTVENALKAAKYRGAFISFVIFALFGGIVLVLWYGAGLVSKGEITIGDLTSFIIYTSFIGASVGGLGDMYGQLQKAIGSSERVLEILDETGEEQNENFATTDIRYDGFVKFENVHFSYPTRTDIEVLKGLDLEIFPGQKIAIVGQSGGGKTTITQLLMKFYNLDSGNILVDNKSIDKLPLYELRKNIGLVPQEVLLFGGTIRENIAYGKPEATENEIVEAARKANAIDFINAFPEKLDTIVGERGVKLSGGQRQRVAIARAILKNPPILVLDEATSALDSESENLVQVALNELMKNRTTIIIAHRLSTIRDADKIVVLQNGKVAESGTHQELIRIEKGVYNNLLRIQNEHSTFFEAV
ncbi:MAG: ABC transporter ATP-binding protein [Cytophagales bacterium]